MIRSTLVCQCIFCVKKVCCKLNLFPPLFHDCLHRFGSFIDTCSLRRRVFI